jgi:hypothetical protein
MMDIMYVSRTKEFDIIEEPNNERNPAIHSNRGFPGVLDGWYTPVEKNACPALYDLHPSAFEPKLINIPGNRVNPAYRAATPKSALR